MFLSYKHLMVNLDNVVTVMVEPGDVTGGKVVFYGLEGEAESQFNYPSMEEAEAAVRYIKQLVGASPMDASIIKNFIAEEV